MAKAKILMLDDEPECLRVTGALLRERGYEVIAANNIQEFLKAFNEYGRTLDLFILDLDMPEMNGAEVIEKFGLFLRDKMIPVIMYTSVYDDEKKSHLLNSLSLYGAYAPVTCIPKSEPERLLKEVPLQLTMKDINDGLTKEEREEKQALDDVLRYRSLEIDRLPYDPEWLRLLELNCKQSGDTESAARYRRMREDYFKRKESCS